jgi:hypothetical protein
VGLDRVRYCARNKQGREEKKREIEREREKEEKKKERKGGPRKPPTHTFTNTPLVTQIHAHTSCCQKHNHTR